MRPSRRAALAPRERQETTGLDDPQLRGDEFVVALRVLHVVEAFGGGVATVVEDYVRSTPEHDHMLLAYRRPDVQTGDALASLVSENLPLPSGLSGQWREVRRQVRRLRPDIVHAHSSFAGALTRLGLPGRRTSTVYTPHCFAFERRDLSPAVRAAFWASEAVFSFGGRWVAAVSDREAQLARALPGRPTAFVVPQLAPELTHIASPRPGSSHFKVVASGRLLPQKDPAWFTAVTREGRRLMPSSTWTWIGGGTPQQEAAVRASGAAVTGWIPRAACLQELRSADVYLHTAAWEGAPMSIFEATALGLPVIARRIPALESLGLPALAEDPATAARLIIEIADDTDRRKRLVEASNALTSRHSRDAQRRALLAVYRQACPDPIPRAAAHGLP